jgi:hypothetical protein
MVRVIASADVHRTTSGAVIDGVYRYFLWRRVCEVGSRRVLFIMLNPSTADATKDDATLRRCVGFACRWRFSFVDVCNLFALRSTNPKSLTEADDPIGPSNDEWIVRASTSASLIIVAWGAHRITLERAPAVLRLLGNRHTHSLGTTRYGNPRHPLDVPRSASLVRFAKRP